MTIDGKSVAHIDDFDVINPSTGEAFAQAPDCDADQLDAAFDAAARAYGDWRTDLALRRETLNAAADAIVANAESLAQVLTLEQGRPVNQSVIELHASAAWFRYFAALDLPAEVIQDDATTYAEVTRKPIGVVAAITPWNFPLLLASWKLAPALLAGNTVVLKPSPYTPLATLALGAALRGVLPPGVLNVVSGRDPLGASMTEHPVPRKISFTGSIATGKRVAAAAAGDLKRVTLELGGNDPAILLDDIDPAAITEKLFQSAFGNNGQICSAIKRVYVHESRYDEVVEALTERVRAAVVGDGFLDGVELGPIQNAPQYERVSQLVASAISDGATATTGGRPMDRPGYFFEPTVLVGAADGTAIVDEEQFGPALPLIPFSRVEDVVAQANATNFGLGASVWGADTDRATSVATQLDSGSVWVNTHMAVAPNLPFGGAKWSGIGVENGPWGYAAFTELQLVLRAR
ncbi:aldehyde dehydrogenase family protein [Jatrophihabitans sp.]|uniref:aldehyde dehydrogenase family protein n=1 Tax=Jatrophihabitans sp. TaxID=1932789 RepID=UPI0030C731B7